MLTKKEFIFLGIIFVVVVVVVVVIVFLPSNNDNSKSNSDNKKTLPPNTPPPMPTPTPPPNPTEELIDPVKMNDPRFDFSNFEIMNEIKEKKEELFCYYSDEFRYGSASNCGLIDFRYEVILLELKTKPTEWKVIVAIRQYKDAKLSGVQYFESKPVPGDVSCLINDSFVEKYYKLCDTTVDECVTQADKAKVGYDGTTCPEEFYVDVEYVLIKKLGDITSKGCVPKNFKINKSSSGEVIFSNNSEDSDGKKYTTKKIQLKK